MFDELDDTMTFTPNEKFRAAVMRGSRAARRRRTAVRVGGATCAAAIAVPAAFALYEYRRLDDVQRISVPGVGDGLPLDASAPTIGTMPDTTGSGPADSVVSTVASASADTTPSTAVPPDELGSVTTFLVVGVDTNEPAGVSGVRSDTIMLLSIDPDHDEMRLLSIPRDLWVHPDGYEGGRRINSLISVNNPQVLVAEIEKLLVVSIDHYVQVDFTGFKDLTDLAGGVAMISDLPLRDVHTGLDIPGGQCVTLNGEQALALVRSRHAEYFDGTNWAEDPRSDFGRIERQHIFLRALIGGLLDELDDPGSIDDFITVATKALVVDQGLDSREMLSTAWTIRGIGLGGLDSATVQASGTIVDGKAVLVPTDEQIADAAEFLRAGTPEPETSPGAEDASVDPASAGEAAADAPASTGPQLRPCDP